MRISSVSNHGVAGALAGSSQIGDKGYDPETYATIYKMTEVINCWVTATVESEVPKDGASQATMAIGAFFGEGSANFTNCYSVGKLAAAKKYADQIAGGFIGRPKVGWQEPLVLRSSYSLGQVSGYYFKGGRPGGLIGYAFGKEDIDMVNSYYGTDANGSNKILNAMTEIKDNTFTSVKGLTVEQMKAQSSFAGFDFNETWAISPDVNDGYPYLRVQRSTAAEGTPTPAPEGQEPVTGDDRTPEELRKAILGEWMEDGMAVNYYAFFEDGSCIILFSNSEPGAFEIQEDRTLKFTTSWTKQTMEWNPESLYDLEGWYLTPEGKLIIEGNVLNRL